MGDAVEMPVVPPLTADSKVKRPVNFRKHRKEDRQWRFRLWAALLAMPLVGGLLLAEGYYATHYWQMRQAVSAGHMVEAATFYGKLQGWWAPVKARGEAAYGELFARRGLYLGYLKAIAPYQMESARLEKTWLDLRSGMMRGQVKDEEVLSRLEEVVRANHQLVQDLPNPELLLHRTDAAIHQEWVHALRLREQGLTQLWYAFHLHDPRKVTSANELMMQSREAEGRYQAGMASLEQKLGRP